MASTENQRRSQRHWVAVPVRIRARGSRMDGVTLNFSEGGMYLFAAANFSIGDEIEIAFRPPNSKTTLRLRGIVQRKAVYLYGIEFLHHAIDRPADWDFAKADAQTASD
jgi:hypothetical protein